MRGNEAATNLPICNGNLPQACKKADTRKDASSTGHATGQDRHHPTQDRQGQKQEEALAMSLASPPLFTLVAKDDS